MVVRLRTMPAGSCAIICAALGASGERTIAVLLEFRQTIAREVNVGLPFAPVVLNEVGSGRRERRDLRERQHTTVRRLLNGRRSHFCEAYVEQIEMPVFPAR